MSEQQDKPAEGWGWPARSKKAHYFFAGRSLCMRWGFFGQLDGNASKSGPDDCVVCARKAAERAPKGARS